MTKTHLIVCLVVLTFSTVFAAADDAVIIEYLGSVLWGQIVDVETRGNYAYCAMHFGLMIVDISDPAEPVFVSKLYIDGENCHTRAVALTGDFAVLCTNRTGIAIVDISDPTSPFIAARQDTPGSAVNLDIKDNYAYVACYDSGLCIIDISDPSAPAVAGGLYSRWVFDIAVKDDYICLGSDFYRGLLIYDISDPADLHYVDKYNPGSNIKGIEIIGEIAYIAANSYGFFTLDISDPYNPVELGRYDTDDLAYDVEAAGDYAFVNCENERYRTFDVSNPSIPVYLGYYPLAPHSCYGMHYSENKLFVAEKDKGLKIIDVSDPADQSLIGEYNLSFDHGAVVVADDCAFTFSKTSDLFAVDISNPNDPSVIGHLEIGPNWADMDLKDDYLYLLCNDLYVIGVADPGNMEIVGMLDMVSSGSAIEVAGDHAYSANSHILNVIDISDPASPELVGTASPWNIFYDLTVSGNYLYAGCSNAGLYIIDISDPTDPVQVGRYETDPLGITAVEVAENRAYVTIFDEPGIAIIDVSDPTSPYLLGTYGEQLYGFYTALRGNYFYVCDSNTRLRIFDIFYPHAPQLIGLYQVPGTIRDLAVSGNYVFPAGRAGFPILQTTFASPECGDFNNSGGVDVGDCVYMINHIFKQGPPPIPVSGGDVNSDGMIDIADAVYMINYIFKNGPPPGCL